MTDLDRPEGRASRAPQAPARAPASPEAGQAGDDLDAWGNPDGTIPRALIDPDAIKILRRLQRHGFAAYLVGGGVRDLLLGRRPKDFDIATSARPEEVKRLFRNCRIIGRRFRLAHIFFGEKIIEVSTFRALVEPVANGGAPAEAAETSDVAEQVDLLIRSDNVFGTAEEDAVRRDFTINGLFYDVERGEVIDYVGGQEDLARRVVRTIGDPDVRFREDPIRMLRAIKFAARLGFDLDPATAAALRRHRHDIRRSAPPRILEEVLRLLGSGAATASFRLMAETEVLEVILPELQNLYRLAQEANPIARYFWGALEAHFDAIDEYDRGRRSVGNAVLAGVLAMPLLLDRPPSQPAWALPAALRAPGLGAGGAGEAAVPGGRRGSRLRARVPRRGGGGERPARRAPHGGVAGEIDGLVAALGLRLTLSRRDTAVLRGALFVLWRMLAQPRSPRAAVLARRSSFPEALVLLRLRNLACRQALADEVAHWERAAAGVPRLAPPTGAAADEAPSPRGRRRKRGRRGAVGPGADAPVPALLVGGPAAARASAGAGRFDAGPGSGGDGRHGPQGGRRRRRPRGPRKPGGDHDPA